jgi:hypothetical protein
MPSGTNHPENHPVSLKAKTAITVDITAQPATREA